jgi:hypothetical protein
MEDGWESHVSPLVMGVGMGDLQGMGEMQAPGQEMPVEMNMPHQHHQELASHPELNPAIHQDIEQDLGREMGRNDMRSHHEGLGGHDDYFSHQVGETAKCQPDYPSLHFSLLFAFGIYMHD